MVGGGDGERSGGGGLAVNDDRGLTDILTKSMWSGSLSSSDEKMMEVPRSLIGVGDIDWAGSLRGGLVGTPVTGLRGRKGGVEGLNEDVAYTTRP